MERGLSFAVEVQSPELRIGIILAVLKHSGKIPSDNELLKIIETVGEIRGGFFFIYKYKNIHEVSGFVLLPTN